MQNPPTPTPRRPLPNLGSRPPHRGESYRLLEALTTEVTTFPEAYCDSIFPRWQRRAPGLE